MTRCPCCAATLYTTDPDVRPECLRCNRATSHETDERGVVRSRNRRGQIVYMRRSNSALQHEAGFSDSPTQVRPHTRTMNSPSLAEWPIRVTAFSITGMSGDAA